MSAAAHAIEPDPAAAGAAFKEGEAAFTDGRFEAAAQDFDRAYALAPHHAPLWNGARAWDQAGNEAEAATRYAWYLREAPADAPDRERARQRLTELEPSLARIRLTNLEPAQVRIDDRSILTAVVYLPPGRHELLISTQEDVASAVLVLAAGAEQEISPETGGAAPPPPAPAPTPQPVPEEPKPAVPATPNEPPTDKTNEGSSGWPLWIGAMSGGVTLLVGGHAVWSGIDTLNARDEFDENPTDEGLEEGQRKQTRTNFLIGSTAALAAFTVVALAVGDWGGDDNETGTKAGRLRVVPFGSPGTTDAGASVGAQLLGTF